MIPVKSNSAEKLAAEWKLNKLGVFSKSHSKSKEESLELQNPALNLGAKLITKYDLYS